MTQNIQFPLTSDMLHLVGLKEATTPSQSQAPENSNSAPSSIDITPLQMRKISQLSPAPTPADPVFITYKKEFPVQDPQNNTNPIDFRHADYKNSPYPCPISPNASCFKHVAPEDLENRLFLSPATHFHCQNPHEIFDTLRFYVNHCLNGFSPVTMMPTHPVHHEIDKHCQLLLTRYRHVPLEGKIALLESAVTEMTVRVCCGKNPSYKDVELASQNPTFELIEIAIRHHLFWGAMKQLSNCLVDIFKNYKSAPSNLSALESAMRKLLTKDNFHPHIKDNFVAEVVLRRSIGIIAQNFSEEVQISLPLNEALISIEKNIREVLKSWQLAEPSSCFRTIKNALIEGSTQKIIAQLGVIYKQEFQQSGAINQEQLQSDMTAFHQFLVAHGKDITQASLLDRVTKEIFDEAYLEKITSEIEKEKKEELSKRESSSRLWQYMGYTQEWCKKTIEQQAQKGIATLSWLFLTSAQEEQAISPSQLYLPPSPSPLLPKSYSAPIVSQVLIQTTVPTPSIPAPAPLAQVKPQEENFASYVDLAFADLFKGDDQETWNGLPLLVQIDVLRHATVTTSIQGKAEALAHRLFPLNELRELDRLKKAPSTQQTSGSVDPSFREQGEELLNFFYSSQMTHHAGDFFKRLWELPIEKAPNFLYYVYQIAKESKVYTDESDPQWAEHHWNTLACRLISLQALERCLHAQE